MKLLVFGEKAEELKKELTEQGAVVVDNQPDVVISYGGDGTLLRAERAYPSIPKLPVRNSKVCKLCSGLDRQTAWKRLLAGDYKINQVLKLEVKFNDQSFWALNDLIITNATPTSAIRYTIKINGQAYAHGREIIGDGIVVATPFGSGAYYRSITDGTFSLGIGLAFNNSTEQTDHVVLHPSDRITFSLTRGQALFAVDTEPLQSLIIGQSIEVTASSTMTAQIISFGEEFSYWTEV